jgi:hypothetical protein
MSARVSLQARVEQYLAERRLLGFKLSNMAQPTGELRALCEAPAMSDRSPSI